MDELPILTFENEIYYYILAWQKQINAINGWTTAKDVCPQIENCC